MKQITNTTENIDVSEQFSKLDDEANTLLEKIAQVKGEEQIKLRAELLELYGYTSDTLYRKNKKIEAYELYQRGIKHAEEFLAQGKISSIVQGYILHLYSSATTTLAQTNQIGRETQFSAVLGLC